MGVGWPDCGGSAGRNHLLAVELLPGLRAGIADVAVLVLWAISNAYPSPLLPVVSRV